MADYDFTLHHKPGSQMLKVDLLSRRADHNHGKDDNINITLLKAEHFRLQEFELPGPEDEIISRILRNKGNKDKSIVKALASKEEDWKEDVNGLVTWKNRVYVPKDKSLREKIIRLHHDLPSAGYPRRYKTQKLLTRNYW